MSKSKILLLVLIATVGVGLFVAAFACLLFFDKENGATASSVISFFLCAVSFVLTFYSTKVLFTDIHHGMICSHRMAEKGARVIAENINSFQPTVIVYVSGNSDSLYKRYIKQYDKTRAKIYVLSSMQKSNICPYVRGSFICTNKFYLDIELLKKVCPDERIVILDDVSKTGETVYRISQYLTSVIKVPEANILTCGFIVDKFGYAKHALPGSYYKKAEVKDNYTFPWMKK